MNRTTAISAMWAALALSLAIGVTGFFALMPPCPTEDSTRLTGCYWDAAERSNGRGESYITIGTPDAQITIQLR